MDIEKAREMLQQGDADTRREAVTFLSKQKETQAIELLLTTAIGDEDADVRLVAAYALVQIGDAGIIPLLEAMTDQDFKVGINADTIISMMGDAAVDSLIAALSDEREEIRHVAHRALISNLGCRPWSLTETPIETLIRALNETDGETRAWIIMILGGRIPGLEGTEATSAIEVATPFLADEGITGFAAALALVGAGDEKAWERLDQLWNVPDDDPSYSMRYSAISTLEQVGDKRAIPLFIRALTNSDSLVRGAAVRALAKVGGTEAVHLLISALADEASGVRQDAIEALQQIGSPTVEPLLAALESTEDEDALWTILWTLRKIDDPRAQVAVEAARATYGNSLSSRGKLQAGETGQG